MKVLSFHLKSGGQSKGFDPTTNIPQLSITLPNGMLAETDLKYFETHIKPWRENESLNNTKQIKHSNSCTYIGRLKGDANSVVAVSGCLHIDKNIPENKKKMQLTIFSNKTNSTKFVIDKFGNMTEVKPDGLTDILIKDEEYPNHPSSASYRRSNMLPQNENFPKEINVHIAFGYDKSVKDYFEEVYSVKDAIEKVGEWISDIHIHMQSYYHLSSLRTKINLKVCILKNILMTTLP